MKFDYLFFEERFCPIVPVRLKGKEEWVELNAFVDTGATYCLFPADAAEALGLSLEDGESREITVGDGNVLHVYLHKILISVAGKEFTAIVGFTKGLGVGFYILGTTDIFDRFRVCFQQKEKYVEFTLLPEE